MVSSSPKLVCVVRDSLYDRCTCENLVRDKFTRVSGDVRVCWCEVHSRECVWFVTSLLDKCMCERFGSCQVYTNQVRCERITCTSQCNELTCTSQCNELTCTSQCNELTCTSQCNELTCTSLVKSSSWQIQQSSNTYICLVNLSRTTHQVRYVTHQH